MVLGNNRARAERRNEPLTPGDGKNILELDTLFYSFISFYLILHYLLVLERPA